MSQRISMIALLGNATLSVACGSDDSIAVRFTIERPPPSGVHVVTDFAHGECAPGTLDCLSGGLLLPEPVTTSGTMVASFAEVVSNPPFDARAVNDIVFVVEPEAFDFCLRDLQFLDANGVAVEEVVP